MKPFRLFLLGLGALAAALIWRGAGALDGQTRPAAHERFHLVEATIPEMRAAMEQERVTSHELVTQYLARIGIYEDKLHGAITVNPHALEEADERDRERAQGHVRGPLHGIPIALKDNILTHQHADHGRRARLRWLRAALRSHADRRTCATRARSSSPRPG